MKIGEPYISISVKQEGFGLSKTLPFTKEGLEKLRKIIEFLEKELMEEGSVKP